MATTNPDSLGYKGQRCKPDKMATIIVAGIKFQVNAIQAPLWKMFLEEYHTKVESLNLEGWDGSFACRPVRGTKNTPSWHGWGCACDLNASRHPLGHSGTFSPKQVSVIQALCKKYGLVWGGDFKNRKDEMHFEMHLTPAEVKAKLKELNKPPVKKAPAKRKNPHKTPTRLLKEGMSGDDVSWVQWALGYSSKGITGKFDRGTTLSVKSFQVRHKLDDDGVVGPKTKAELAKVVR